MYASSLQATVFTLATRDREQKSFTVAWETFLVLEEGLCCHLAGRQQTIDAVFGTGCIEMGASFFPYNMYYSFFPFIEEGGAIIR